MKGGSHCGQGTAVGTLSPHPMVRGYHSVGNLNWDVIVSANAMAYLITISNVVITLAEDTLVFSNHLFKSLLLGVGQIPDIHTG